MNIAIVGGGEKCSFLINLMEKHDFKLICPKIVAVADIDENAKGYRLAREMGIFVTTDYNDFFKMDDIEQIIELTGDLDIYDDIVKKKNRNVRAIAHTTAVLFWELSRMSNIQKETDQKLKKTMAKYDVVFNQIVREDVMVISNNYRFMEINETLLNKLKLKREQTIDRHCYNIIYGRDEPCTGLEFPCPFKAVMNNGKPVQVTHVNEGLAVPFENLSTSKVIKRVDQENSQDVYYSISCYPLFDNGETIGAMIISRDITKEMSMQRVMMEQEKLASIGRLSAGVAHEINNPLTTILTTAMLLQEEQDETDPAYEELTTISNEVLRCRKIVKSLLDFARQTKPEKKLSAINEIVMESFFLTRKQAEFVDVKVKTDMGNDIPLSYMDNDLIAQAMINLSLNAIEACKPRCEVIFTTSYDEQNDTIEISVSDNGSGIPVENQSSLFEPFFTTKQNGTGLGLAITHGIIQQHHGTINVQSDGKEGTRFIISLPVDPDGNLAKETGETDGW